MSDLAIASPLPAPQRTVHPTALRVTLEALSHIALLGAAFLATSYSAGFSCVVLIYLSQKGQPYVVGKEIAAAAHDMAEVSGDAALADLVKSVARRAMFFSALFAAISLAGGLGYSIWCVNALMAAWKAERVALMFGELACLMGCFSIGIFKDVEVWGRVVTWLRNADGFNAELKASCNTVFQEENFQISQFHEILAKKVTPEVILSDEQLNKAPAFVLENYFKNQVHLFSDQEIEKLIARFPKIFTTTSLLKTLSDGQITRIVVPRLKALCTISPEARGSSVEAVFYFHKAQRQLALLEEFPHPKDVADIKHEGVKDCIRDLRIKRDSTQQAWDGNLQDRSEEALAVILMKMEGAPNEAAAVIDALGSFNKAIEKLGQKGLKTRHDLIDKGLLDPANADHAEFLRKVLVFLQDGPSPAEPPLPTYKKIALYAVSVFDCIVKGALVILIAAANPKSFAAGVFAGLSYQSPYSTKEIASLWQRHPKIIPTFKRMCQDLSTQFAETALSLSLRHLGPGYMGWESGRALRFYFREIAYDR